MGVGVVGAARAPARVPPLRPHKGHCAAQCLDIPAVTIDEDETRGPLAGGSCEFHEDFYQRRCPNRDGPGEAFVLTTGTVADGWGDQPVGFNPGAKAQGKRMRHCSRDASVGVQRQVRSMLLGGT